MSKKTIISIVIFLLPLAAPAFDFKGIQLGGPATPEQILEKLGVTCGKGIRTTQVCNGSVTIAREPATLNLLINEAGIVQRMDLSLSPAAFGAVAPELIAKFGAPNKTTSEVLQNRMGAKFDQVIHIWQGDRELQLTYDKYSGSVSRSRIYFSTKEDRELMGRSKANRAGDI